MTVGDFVTLMARSRSGSWTTCWSSSRTRTSPTFPRSSQRSGLTSETSWAQDFVRTNRDEMMDRVMTELSYLWFKANGHQAEIEQERINCHHNFTQLGSHFGRHVWLTQKGAIQMRKGQLGQLGVIPGLMGTRSYIVAGLENPMAYHSAPHGAGRRFSRSEARRRFTKDDMEKAMQGIEYRPRKSSSTSFSVPTRTSTR